MAEAIARGEHFDSSAQGEQPKFTARLNEGDCLVKFTGRVEQREIESVPGRWADLLHAEALAAGALNQAWPNMAAPNRSFEVSQRTLLASERFDRTPQGGRIGVISFASLDAEFLGRASENWPVIADGLHQQKVITEKAATQCKVAWAFGQLIANSDMHLGNVSALNMSGRPYELAPIYDMLPMHYSPKPTGDLPADAFQIHMDPAVSRVCWEQAYPAAILFWQRVLKHSAISEQFKTLARQQLQVVKEFEVVIRKMA
ncbi:HipA domain-containing protein [Aliidiomarina minuta]|uniref:HipA domain-containing protein n=1 Tax=Aliidiomarina minuta TaxID=880057 RepID=UPI000F88E807|nr:HipA domain-containing protein [Aliidiomarina minuta]